MTQTDPRALVTAVSRSFALSLRILPRPVRGTMQLGYLLARASDTIADSSQLPTAERLAALEQLARRIAGEPALDLAPRLPDLAATTRHPGEGQLLRLLPTLLDRLDREPPDDRRDLQLVLTDILHGQQLDLQRLAKGSGRFLLPDDHTLLEYTDLVAGSVGDFWSRVCLRKLPDYSRAAPDELRKLGRRFGQGLQLVNILRDFPADAESGRCYLPAADLPIDARERVFDDPTVARESHSRWRAEADRRLYDGLRYADRIRPRRLRFAVAFPARLGLRTLAAAHAGFPRSRIRLPRKETRRLALTTLAHCLLGKKMADDPPQATGSPPHAH